MKRLPTVLMLAIGSGLALAGCQDQPDQYGSPGAIVSTNSIPDPLFFPLVTPDFLTPAKAAPRYTGDVQPLDQPVRIGRGSWRQLKARSAMDIKFGQDEPGRSVWFSARSLAKREKRDEEIVIILTVEELYAGGEETLAAVFRMMKGVSFFYTFDKNLELQDVEIKGGRLADGEDFDALIPQAEAMLKNLVGLSNKLGVRDKPISQGDVVADLTGLTGQFDGELSPIKIYARGRTSFLGRPSLFTIATYENFETGMIVSGHSVIDLETGVTLTSVSLVQAPTPDGTIMEVLVTFTVDELQ